MTNATPPATVIAESENPAHCPAVQFYREKVHAYLRAHPNASHHEIAAACGIPIITAGRAARAIRAEMAAPARAETPPELIEMFQHICDELATLSAQMQEVQEALAALSSSAAP